jgi:hypothetical protein
MVRMSSRAPRRHCQACERSIAVVGGRFARHDPPDRGPELLSCSGSLTKAPILDEPDRAGTPSLFDVLAELEPANL